MDSPSIICTFVSTLIVIGPAAVDGQINRYINPTWLEMDANSEYYPGGEVLSQILQEYGLGAGDAYEPARYRSSVGGVGGAVIGRSGYGRSYPRFRMVNSLNNAYDSDPLAQEYLDRNYDYVDNTIRGSNRYRTSLLDYPRRSRINSMVSLPRTTYHQSEYADRNLPLVSSYPRSRTATIDPNTYQDLALRGRETTATSRLIIPRSTAVPDTSEKRKI